MFSYALHVFFVLQFILKVFSRNEVRVLCRPLEILHSNFGKVCLNEASFVNRSIAMVEHVNSTKWNSIYLKLNSYYWHSIQLCAYNFGNHPYGCDFQVSIKIFWPYCIDKCIQTQVLLLDKTDFLKDFQLYHITCCEWFMNQLNHVLIDAQYM